MRREEIARWRSAAVTSNRRRLVARAATARGRAGLERGGLAEQRGAARVGREHLLDKRRARRGDLLLGRGARVAVVTDPRGRSAPDAGVLRQGTPPPSSSSETARHPSAGRI